MHIFHDAQGRAWPVAITVASAKRVKALTEVNLYGLIEQAGQPLADLCNDPITLVDVLYALAKPEADRLGVSDEAFGEAMYGDAIKRAADAFLAELVDFFPNARQREALQKLIATGQQVSEKLLNHLSEQVATIDADAVAASLIRRSGSAPESSASIPAPSPSEN